MSESDLTELLGELNVHLREMKLAGIPEQWFVQAQAAKAEQAMLVQDEAANQPPLVQEPEEESYADRQPALFAQTKPGQESYSSLNLEELEALAKGCRKCGLCEGRNKVVFGVGTSRPPVVFVGEGPGADEDRQGEPFVGKAGALLTAAITKGMGLRREDVYICNVVKCRPPNNRAPLPDEVQACTPYLFRQLELLQPKVIVALGSPAQRALTGVEIGITKLRGKWLDWRGIKVMPTFHPAYILRSPAAKRPFWEDLQQVMAELGLKK